MGSSCSSSKYQQYNPLLSFLSPSSKVQVLYGGTDLFDYEVRRTFNNDMLLAFISSSCIAALVYILTSCSGRPPWKAQQEPAPFSPACVLLSGQSLPSPECQKSSQIHCVKGFWGRVLRNHLPTPGRWTEVQRQFGPYLRAPAPGTSCG